MPQQWLSFVAGAAIALGGLSATISTAWAKTQLEELVDRAEKGDIESQFKLGELYRAGGSMLIEVIFGKISVWLYSGSGKLQSAISLLHSSHLARCYTKAIGETA